MANVEKLAKAKMGFEKQEPTEPDHYLLAEQTLERSRAHERNSADALRELAQIHATLAVADALEDLLTYVAKRDRGES